ncbi:MAG: CsgG/HfaB family protein [Campylobacterota bacterium]|nr:CsgG/HfaB family protein [Campylobacterota bacterium]
MKKMVKNTLLSGAAIAVLVGCGGNQLDVAKYQTKIKVKAEIPEICMPLYKSNMPKVAVMEFTNNSTFGKAEIANSNTESETSSVSTNKSSAAIGLVANTHGVGLGVSKENISTNNTKSNSNTSSVKRSVDAKLSSSVTGPLETLVVNSGGATLFTRSDMDKVDAELKFQDSGLVDPESAVAFGKTSGVKFILTGSIDNVDQKYRDNSAAADGVAKQTGQSDNLGVKLLGAALSMGASMTDGMIITTKLTVKMIDVETGKIVFSKQLEESGNIGKIRNPNYDQVVGGIKKAMLEALPELKQDFATYFAVKGYITKLRKDGDDVIAQVSIGRDQKVVENQLFTVYNFEESEDVMTGAKTCDVIETTTKLRASQQIQPKTTWATVEEGECSSLKLKQLVQKSHEKAGFEVPF